MWYSLQMYVWYAIKFKWSQANKWCLRVIALHSKRTWTLRELIVSLHWCRARAVKWARNWKILKILDALSDLQEYQKLNLSQSSGQKGKPEPSERQNCHGKRAIALEQLQPLDRPASPGKSHCKYREFPKRPAAYLPSYRRWAFRSSEKTHRPAARQWAPCLNLYQPKGTVFYFFRVTSRTIREIAWKCMGQHCAQAGKGRPVPSYSKGSTAETGAFPIDFAL